MENGLLKYFEQHILLDKKEKDFIQKVIPIRTIGKDHLLLSEGEISKEFYFLIKGCIRIFYKTEMEEKTAYFYEENSFVSSYESFTKQVPAKHNLQTIEDSTIAVISQKAAAQLLERFPKFELLARIMMEEELIIYQEIISSFVTLNAEQRYAKLLKSNNSLIQRIPQYHLAGFLGVTPETLSRIRKRLSSKKIS